MPCGQIRLPQVVEVGSYQVVFIPADLHIYIHTPRQRPSLDQPHMSCVAVLRRVNIHHPNDHSHHGQSFILNLRSCTHDFKRHLTLRIETHCHAWTFASFSLGSPPMQMKGETLRESNYCGWTKSASILLGWMKPHECRENSPNKGVTIIHTMTASTHCGQLQMRRVVSSLHSLDITCRFT